MYDNTVHVNDRYRILDDSLSDDLELKFKKL